MRVLLLSAYAAQSHCYWRDQLLAMFPDWSWTVLEMPARHFSWRIRGNALHWSIAEREALCCGYELVIATSMVDLATLRGLVPALTAVPTLLYFHENQFAYPQRESSHGLLEAQMVTLYSALSAENVVFNSAYNRQTFLEGCRHLLRRLPDFVPPGIVETLERKSSVLPVPVVVDSASASPTSAAARPSNRGVSPDPINLLWVGRFEHDKGADVLLAVLFELECLRVNYRISVVGQKFRNTPPEFARIEVEFAHRLECFGYLDEKERYLDVLYGSDIVLSTARHEFQGVSVMEAVMAGCVPVVPDGLAYPEIYPAENLFSLADGCRDIEARNAAALIAEVAANVARWRERLPDLSGFYPQALNETYRQAFDATITRHA